MIYSRINIANVTSALLQLAGQLQPQVDGGLDVNSLNAEITNGIYYACKNSCEVNTIIVDDNPNFSNCNSSNFKAMANINLYAHEILSGTNHFRENYLQDWLKYENLALQAENNELNMSCNKAWKNVRHDSKKMWDRIDWRGKDELKNDSNVNESQIKSYFTSIFQSEKTVNNPIVSDVNEDLSQYDFHVPVLDAIPNMYELEIAMKCVRRGISFDGLPPAILEIIPNPLKMIILLLVQKIFVSDYPDEWNLQMLHAVTKHGHTYKDPQLRGIAIAPLLCRVYDALLDNRFSQWYMPNYEQAGFRPKQGCLLPIFTLVVLIIFCKEHGKNLFVGFLDYAKAFDYANRAQLIRDLMDKGCGKAFLRAVYNMYLES